MKKSVIVISHGSRDPSANKDLIRLVQKYRKLHPHWKISHCYLEIAKPSLTETLESLGTKTNEILVLPLFLFAASHVKKHIPEILAHFRKKHPKVKVKLAKPLGSDPKLLEILDQRVRKIAD